MFGDLSFNVENSLLTCNGESVNLMNKKLQIMSILIEKGGNLVSLDTISKNAWDVEAYSTSENVWVFISYLRKKIEGIHSKVKVKSIRYQRYYLEYKDN